MSVVGDLIDGIVEVTTAGGDVAVEKLRGIVLIVALVILLIFLLILFLVEPLSATIITLALVAALILFAQRGGSDVI